MKGAARGFTLFELLVVLVLIGLMTALAAPRLGGTFSRLSAKTAAQRVGATLRFLRSRAAAEKKTYFASFQLEGGTVRFSASEAVDSSETDQPAGLEKPIFLPEGVRWVRGVPFDGDAVNSGEFRIAFFPSGGSTGGTIEIADHDDTRRFAVSADFITGAVRVAELP